MNELKSNRWSSFTVITNIVHMALRCQPKWLQTLGSFSTRARAGRLQCPIAWDTEDSSCMSRDEMQSQLLWRWGPWVDFPQGRTCLQEELSQNHDSSSTASSSTASSSSSNLYEDIVYWNKTVEGLGETGAEETRLQFLFLALSLLTT